MWGHFSHKDSEVLRNHIYRLVKGDLALKIATKDRNRADPDIVADALETLDCLVRPCDDTVSRGSLSSLQDDIARTRGDFP